MKDPEIEAMEKINEALSAVKEEETRTRILSWATGKFLKGETLLQPKAISAQETSTESHMVGNEIPGIAKLTKDGSLEITIRDLKAKSKADAALRLALVIIRAHERLTHKESVSSRRTVTPALKGWRLYDPNIRHRLASYAGIIRKRDELSLDIPAKAEADKYIAEIKDPNVKASWSTGKRK